MTIKITTSKQQATVQNKTHYENECTNNSQSYRLRKKKELLLFAYAKELLLHMRTTTFEKNMTEMIQTCALLNVIKQVSLKNHALQLYDIATVKQLRFTLNYFAYISTTNSTAL